MPAASSPSRPRRAPRVRYINDDSASDEDFEYLGAKTRPTRAARRVQTYRESSDDDTSDSSAVETDVNQGSRLPTPQSETTVRPHRPKRKPPAVPSKKREVPNKRQKTQPSRSVRKSTDVTAVVSKPSTHARIPPWQTLPYFVLVNIMQYAAYPLYGPMSRQQPSINWLCTTGSICRSFHDACMATLLYSPPLYPLQQARGLMTLLKRDQDHPGTLSTSFRSKIRYLDIEVKHLLAKKGGISLDELISLTPQLQGIRLYSNYDDMTTVSWAQPASKKVRWTYPIDLIRRLESNNVVLRSFDWNGRFPNTTDVLKEAMAAHSRPSFKHLRDLTFLNLTLPEKTEKTDIASARSFLAVALKSLSALRSVCFRNCGMIDEFTMPMLPPGLLHLELTNCSHLTSEVLEGYLSSAGQGLQSLKLNNNQSMDLGFMANLKSLCPSLQRLKIDMVYIDPSSWHDRDPLFDELLPNGPPTWPSQLITISIENMRQLTEAAAEKFFASLVDASEDLPFLKKLSLKVILKDASWRDRAKMRQNWMPVFENVFLNTDKPSNIVTNTSSSKRPPTGSQRQSTRIANGRLKELSMSENSDESDASTQKTGQARCDVVDLVISDQRPAETQYRENDFLDSEPSDDEEYRD
ncbi:hypothetical protein G647_03467 [Cladophialophora carrionii CBS 160.54]|uniref:Uncharacterized protein n=1 Tax=Cladophialophora carrionii CBS 160.54 TaxID=1279043 RepID=V9DCR0_9EURO|nr:uncharacterized protein G647_03467 [Cladophialophora carrionii CBS 160.54]ETI24098.1 hypothetical protein G647_03467 [Cladophialophora carrionii CBS 160.54]